MKNRYFLVVPLLGFLSFMVYAFTRVPGHMPGESAFAVTQALEDSMFPTFGHTLWYAMVRLLDGIPMGSFSLRLGLFSALCGAVSVMALASLAWHVPVGHSPEEERTPASPALVRGLVVGCAVCVFVFTPPIWFAATRPLPQMFGLTLLLVTGAWTVRTFQKRSAWMLGASSFLWGLLVTEYATAWFFVPVFFLMVLITGFTPEGRFRLWRNLRLLLFFLIGASLGYFFMARAVLSHPNAELQDIHDMGSAFLNSLRVQRNLLRDAAPAEGSLLVLVLFGGPFFWAFLPKAHATLEVRIGSVFFHLVCAVVNGIMLFNPPASPWGLYQTGRLGVFMVVPSAMLALSTGYLAGYWVGVLAKYDPFQPLVLRVSRYTLRALVRPLTLGLVGASTLLNILWFPDPLVGKVNHAAREMAEVLRDHETYVGESGFNNLLRLVLREKGIETRVVDLEPGLWAREPFRLIMARRFEEENPRLASMARVGAAPLLHAWMQTDPAFNQRVRLGDGTEVIRRAGFVPLPVPFGYAAVADISPESLQASQLAMASVQLEPMPSLWDAAARQRGRSRAISALVVHYTSESRRANNLGVLMEEMGFDEEAFALYRKARDLRPDNVSALLNLAMRGNDLSPAEQERVRGEMERFVEDLGAGRLNAGHLWRLSAVYGDIRHPRMLVDRGWAWVASGNPRLAVPEFREALRRDPGAEGLRLQLAHAHFAGEDLDASEAEYIQILENNPDSTRALLGLARVHGARGETDEAMAYLTRLRDRGVDPALLRREEVAALTLGGRHREAAARADEWLRAEPDNPRALLSRLFLAETEGDPTLISDLNARLDRLDGLAPPERLLLARFAFQRGDEARARTHLRRALDAPATRAQVLELLLGLEVRVRNQAEAERLVNQLLALDPNHAYGNYILGSLHLARGNTREAIAAFEASIATRPSAGALNDLAYTLHQRGRNEEALPLARQAIALEPASPHAHGTLASIFLGQGQTDAAADSLQNALAIAPNHPPFLLLLARVYQARDMTREAREVVDQLLSRPERLPPDTHRELLELDRRLR